MHIWQAASSSISSVGMLGTLCLSCSTLYNIKIRFLGKASSLSAGSTQNRIKPKLNGSFQTPAFPGGLLFAINPSFLYSSFSDAFVRTPSYFSGYTLLYAINQLLLAPLDTAQCSRCHSASPHKMQQAESYLSKRSVIAQFHVISFPLESQIRGDHLIFFFFGIMHILNNALMLFSFSPLVLSFCFIHYM